jgi:hypothetical protein
MERVQIFCKMIIKAGAAFGVRMDTGEEAFIPTTLVESVGLHEGETVDAVLVPNTRKGATTEWFAVRLLRDERPSPPPPAPALSIDDRAYSTIKISDGYLTTAEMAELLGTDTTIAHNALLRLFNQGKIAKADVYGSGGQSRPSFCLWASSAKAFVGEEE